MQIFNLPQQSEEWFELRKGKMTASHAQAIGLNGAGLKTYIRELMAEYYSKGTKKRFSNFQTDRGNDLEPSAAMVYSFKTGLEVQRDIGFVLMGDYVGCSPDSFVCSDGLAEIKCPDDKAYFDLLLDGKIESKYIWQMQMQMLVCGKSWCDFVAYNPNFKQDVWIDRVLPDPKKFDALKAGFESGIKMINEIKERLAA